MSAHRYTDHIGYRDLLVSNNSESETDRLRLYAINLEHSMAEANAELRNASSVDIFGLKKEGSTTILCAPQHCSLTDCSSQKGPETALMQGFATRRTLM